MDPEKLLAQLQAALDRGADPATVEARLARVSSFTTVQALRDAVANAAAPAPVQEAQGEAPEKRGLIDAIIAGLGRGLTGDFLDEITGTVLSSDIGATLLGRSDLKGLSRDEAIALARGSQDELASERPFSTGAGLITGAIAGPGAALGKVAGLGRGGVGLGGTANTILGRAGTAAGQLAGVGGVEAGLFAAGSEEGGFEERLEAGAEAVPVGGVVGLATGGLLGTASGLRRARAATRGGGERLAQDVRDVSGLEGSPRGTQGRIDAKTKTARETFEALESQGAQISPELTQEAIDNPLVRAELRRLRTQGSKKVIESIEKFEAGEAGSVVPLSFQQAQDIARNLRNRASFFKKGGGGARPGRVDSVREAEEAFDALDGIMRESLEGFDDAQNLWAAQAREARSLQSGRKLWTKGAVDIEDAASAISDPAALLAFREGLATQLVKTLESGSAGVARFIDKAQTGSDVQRKLRVLLGGDDALSGFLEAVGRESRVISRAQFIENLVKFGGFSLLGSSLAGGAALTIF